MSGNTPRQNELFERTGFPSGLHYRADFLSAAEESDLLDAIRELPLEEADYKGWKAKRRIVSYGGRYDFDSNVLGPADPIPAFLMPLRARVAAEAGLAEEALAYALVAEYRPGVQLGWHRDVPSFEEVVGVSLLGFARMRFRPYPPTGRRRTAFALELAPRSLYVLRGDARWRWQHAVSPTKALRYSITFRTLRSAE
ncbi:MAG TPA: alpha-ketoglutarate-dependent dioxygenase AlkB [Gammaproteobacteria bacterium]